MRESIVPVSLVAISAAILATLFAGCSQSSGPMVSARLIYGDGPPSVTDGAEVEAGVARCCALQVADGSASGNCSTLARNSLGVLEPCLVSHDGGGGTYGLWTCGTASPQAECMDNGLSCNLGDPCTLTDVGCPGVVQPCTFTPYTPPPQG